MKMTKDAINARKLRLAVITNLFKQGELTESEAKEVLAGNLSPDDKDTFVDDSALLGDPDGLNKIEAEDEKPNCPYCLDTHVLLNGDEERPCWHCYDFEG